LLVIQPLIIFAGYARTLATKGCLFNFAENSFTMQVHSNPTIETPRLILVCCTKELLEALFQGEDSLSRYLDITIPQHWTEFGEPAFKWIYEQITKPGAKAEWFGYLPILKEENTLAGSCGFKGAPNKGAVEIGYEVAAVYRGRGLATEIANGLIKHALKDEAVTLVQAHTLAEENASVTVLKKNHMVHTATVNDPDDGELWQWQTESK
jgi:RimJ/RimL family protein N-acetyltransferase